MTDLELVDKYVESCRDFVNPKLFREIQSRGLYDIVNFLPKDVQEAKAVAYARMRKRESVFGDPEIDTISGEINMLEKRRKLLSSIQITEVHKLIPILEDMLQGAKYIKDYFKE